MRKTSKGALRRVESVIKFAKHKHFNNVKEARFKNTKSIAQVGAVRLNYYSDIIIDALEKYVEEIESTLLAYNRKSCNETMMVNLLRSSSENTTRRKTHMENLEGIAVEIAKKLNLNVGVARIIARCHDIGHTWLGHNGEYWLSNVKDNFGIGYYCHNALGPQQLIYREKIYDEIMNKIKIANPDISSAEENRIRKSLWLIFDGINSHNGEKSEAEFIPNKSKTENDFEREVISCFTTKGFDRTIMPATFEGCLIRLCDKISYIPYDMIDGIREGIIDEIDEEYAVPLRQIGITTEEIDRANQTRNYEPIAKKMQTIFTEDVIKNSTGNAIRMSDKISTLMHDVRTINNRRIVKYAVLEEDHKVYSRAVKELMIRYSNIILENDLFNKITSSGIDIDDIKRLKEKYKGTPDEDFINYFMLVTPEDYEFTQQMITIAVRNNIGNEQKIARDIVLGHEAFVEREGYEEKTKRIREYMKYYIDIGLLSDYSEREKKADIDKAFLQQFGSGDDIKTAMFPNLALEFGAKFLSTLNDVEFFRLIKKHGLIDKKTEKSLTRTYRDIGQAGLKKEAQPPSQFNKTVQQQLQDLGRGTTGDKSPNPHVAGAVATSKAATESGERYMPGANVVLGGEAPQHSDTRR